MLIPTREGPRAVEEAEVLALYRSGPDGSHYLSATLCMASGEEVVGLVPRGTLDRLEAMLNDFDASVVLDPEDDGTKCDLTR
jgi:hypothetical protein